MSSDIYSGPTLHYVVDWIGIGERVPYEWRMVATRRENSRTRRNKTLPQVSSLHDTSLCDENRETRKSEVDWCMCRLYYTLHYIILHYATK